MRFSGFSLSVESLRSRRNVLTNANQVGCSPPKFCPLEDLSPTCSVVYPPRAQPKPTNAELLIDSERSIATSPYKDCHQNVLLFINSIYFLMLFRVLPNARMVLQWKLNSRIVYQQNFEEIYVYFVDTVRETNANKIWIWHIVISLIKWIWSMIPSWNLNQFSPHWSVLTFCIRNSLGRTMLFTKVVGLPR